MHNAISSLVVAPVLWRVLVAAAVIGVRVMLDEVVPRGRVVGRTQSGAPGRN
jgi:hypothetical protein